LDTKFIENKTGGERGKRGGKDSYESGRVTEKREIATLLFTIHRRGERKKGRKRGGGGEGWCCGCFKTTIKKNKKKSNQNTTTT